MKLATKATPRLESASSIRVWGKESVRSTARPMIESVQPPLKPEMMPRTVPRPIAMKVADSAIASEGSRMPYQTRDRTSRPVPGSTPSGWSQLTPPNFPMARPSRCSRR